MDRRQQKTRQAIFRALTILLEQKNFSYITVQEIIDEANIGRSTFYAHFETKDHLIYEMCSDIFAHVFSEDLQTEGTHDFSNSSHDLRERITHVLYHLKDSNLHICQLLSGESGELFMNYFKKYLPQMFETLIKLSNSALPKAYLNNYLVGSFADTVMWWVNQKMEQMPEQVAEYYLTVIQKGIF